MLFFFFYFSKYLLLSKNHILDTCDVQTGFFILSLQSNLEVLGTLRERQLKLKEDALVLQEQMTEFRNNIVKEVHYNIITYIVY